MSQEFPSIPPGLVFRHENWKVLTTFPSPVSTMVGGTWFDEMAQIALLLPKEPGTGGFWKGFHMRLAKMVEGELKSKGAKHLEVHDQGEAGFVMSGWAWMMLSLDKKDMMWDQYKEEGHLTKMEELSYYVGRHRENLVKKPAIQAEFEAAALDIAPSLAWFFLLNWE